LVERNLAKVEVAGSSLVFRSEGVMNFTPFFIFNFYPGGGTGRHAGLKILWAAMLVRVQLPPGVQKIKATVEVAFDI
jgi:hypothetical protein